MRHALPLAALLALASSLAACGDDDGGSVDPSPDAGAPADDAGAERDPDFVAGCTYVNGFSGSEDCKEYRGPGWSPEGAARDCERVFLGEAGAFVEGEACAFEEEVGRCVVGTPGQPRGYVLVSSGDPTNCGAAQSACETFAGGTFEPAPICASCEPGEETGQPFIPMFVDCRDPIEGEPAGAGPDGQVCTPTIISGSTEPGRRYTDYADCSVVLTQRPYYAEDAGVEMDPEDPRLDDAEYMAEVDWLKEQAEASACACCHTASDTPEGAAIWDTEAGPLWVDTISDEALAMLAGFTDSAGFGFLPAEENNGFDRSETGLPTTDVPRLRAFAERELARRELSVEEARELEPFAPFFRELIEFEPEACPEGTGVDADGQLRWTGGGARYVHVLEADAQAPGTPPNWDLPEGTLWAISVPPDVGAMGCGMAYGELPEGAVQRVPAEGAPPALESGEQYFLYVQRDIVQPITRCLFTAP